MDAWTVDFSVLTTRARRQWNNVFKGTNNCPIMKIIVPKIVYLEKLSFKNKGKPTANIILNGERLTD